MYLMQFIALKVDHEKRLMVIVNRSIDHPLLPVSNKYVRVDTYMSKMVIKPHTSFDEVRAISLSTLYSKSNVRRIVLYRNFVY